MHGDVQVEEPSGSTTVGKNKTATFNLAAQSQPVIAKSLVEQPLDKWDSDAVQYHKSYANASSFGNSPYAYGINDLNYYGSFHRSGCGGSMWRPYFTSASWDPFGSGAWAYYPERWLFLGITLSVGLDAVSLRQLVLLSGSWLGLAAGRRLDRTGQQFVRQLHSGSGNSLATNRPRPPIHPPTAMQSGLGASKPEGDAGFEPGAA